MSIQIQNQITEVTVTPEQTKVTVQSPGVQGAQGVQGQTGATGAAGPNEIGNYPIEVTAPQQGDVLQFNASSKWVNSPQANITDGGNF